MIFFPPDTGGGDGGGGAAIAEPTAGGEGGDPNADLMTFDAPSLEHVEEFIKDKRADVPPAPPKTPKKVDAKVDEPKPVAKPEVKPDDQIHEPKNSTLRAELAAVKKERDDLKASLEKGDPRLKEIEESVKAKETEIKERDTKLADYERRLALANPEVTKKRDELFAAYNRDADKFHRSSTIDQEGINALTIEFAKLPFGKAEFKDARLEFEKKVNEALGGTDEQESRKLQSTLDYIERTYDFVKDRDAVNAEINSSAVQKQREYQSTEYGKKASFVKERIEIAKKPPEGMKESNPFHPKVMLDIFEGLMPEEQRKEFTNGVPEFVELVMAGPRPRNDADYVGMTPAQIKESKAAEDHRYETARGHAVDVMYNGLRALRMFPAMVREVQRLREKVKEGNDTTPPDPTKTGGASESHGGDDDLRDFKTPNLDDLRL